MWASLSSALSANFTLRVCGKPFRSSLVSVLVGTSLGFAYVTHSYVGSSLPAFIVILQILCVFLSWKKLDLGNNLTSLGWRLTLCSGFWASLPERKQGKVLCGLAWWRLRPRRVPRRVLAQLLGFLLWAAQVRLALRAFMALLFRRLNMPGTRLQCLGLGSWRNCRVCLKTGLWFSVLRAHVMSSRAGEFSRSLNSL